MKKLFLTSCVFISGLACSYALVINEVMSNPIGDDGGREWVEIYNNSGSSIDLSSLAISIKGANPITVTALSGGTVLEPNGYAIIGSTVSGATKFLIDYPAYSSPLFKSGIALVNTGTTSLEIKVAGTVMDTLSAYTAAKEGATLSRFVGGFSPGLPTPGAENQSVQEEVQSQSPSATKETQMTLAQAAPPASDIVLYLPSEKVVVAGGETTFSVFGLTHTGRALENLTYRWAFGDGGQAEGSSTAYRYAYPGKYIASVESGNGYVLGTARMNVRVIAPDISIKSIATGKYGAYIDIENPNAYDLDLSQWRLIIDGASFPFPKNTFIAKNSITRFSGLAMGFAKTVIATSTSVKILFPNLEEVTHYTISGMGEGGQVAVSSTTAQTVPKLQEIPSYIKNKITRNTQSNISKASSSGENLTSPQPRKENQKDTRIVAFFRSFFGKK